MIPSIISTAAYARSTSWAQNGPDRFRLISFSGLLRALINYTSATPKVTCCNCSIASPGSDGDPCNNATDEASRDLARHARQGRTNQVAVTMRFPRTPPHAFREGVLQRAWSLAWDGAHGRVRKPPFPVYGKGLAVSIHHVLCFQRGS